MKSRHAWVGLALVLACGGPAVTPGGHGAVPSDALDDALAARWDRLSAHFLDRSFVRDPGFAALEGRHERDGDIIDLSRPAIAAWAGELVQVRAEAEAFAAERLDEARRFEREYLLAVLDASLFSSQRLEEQAHSPLLYSNALDPSVYLTRAYAPLEQRLVAYVKHAHNMPKVVDAMIENLELPLPRTFVEVGIQVFGGLVPYLERDVPPIFAAVHDAPLRASLSEATRIAVAAVQRAVSFLRAQESTANDDFALGPALFRELLWATERVDTPLEVLLQEGTRDLARNTAALRAVCSELLPKGSLEACAALVNDDKPSAGPVMLAREQVSYLKQFVREHDLVSIPGNEEARVEEAPPYKRWNQAYIEIPGPYEQGLPSTYYIAPPDPTWSEEEQRGYVPGRMDLLFITVHEVWPGHFLQFLHANRVARPLGRVFVGYAFAEGWAHYAEELTWEAGLFPEDKRARVGQLLNALLRNVRFVSALGLHTQGMSVAESAALFRTRALSDPGNARQQAARGTFDPGYLHYTLGKLMIRKLRDDWTRTRGGRAAYRAFHDRLLSFGGPPLPLVRKAMLGSSAGLL
ncbi:MAG: hypothetical protein JWN48_4713 [Myxococcaceae bacterium]|nr:hypothetical protein [Myxococcaceae bacterium]